MKNSTRLASVAALMAFLLHADTLVLRNGRSIEGTFVGGDSRSVRFDDGRSAVNYPVSDVDSVRFAGGSTSSAQSSSTSYNSGSSMSSWSNNTSQNNQPYPPSAAGSNSIPSGSEMVVRLIDAVNSDTDRLGQTYRVSLDEPVVVNGNTVIERGADAVAFLIDSERSGKIEGRTSLTLDLKTITVNGRQYDVTTTGVSEVSSSRGARSAKVIGGTAAVGAIIGAIAGGGKGAAIGAGSGAAVGTAAQVMTSGQKVKIPAETRLTFTLKNPITL